MGSMYFGSKIARWPMYVKGGINEIAILFWSLSLFKVSGLLTKKVFYLSSGFSIFLSCNCLFRLLMGFLPSRKCYSNRSNFLFFDLEKRLFLVHNVFHWNTATPTLGNTNQLAQIEVFLSSTTAFVTYLFSQKTLNSILMREKYVQWLCQRSLNWWKYI